MRAKDTTIWTSSKAISKYTHKKSFDEMLKPIEKTRKAQTYMLDTYKERTLICNMNLDIYWLTIIAKYSIEFKKLARIVMSTIRDIRA